MLNSASESLNLSSKFLMSKERGVHIPHEVVNSYVYTVCRCIYIMYNVGVERNTLFTNMNKYTYTHLHLFHKSAY